jgi:hypothetical protein
MNAGSQMPSISPRSRAPEQGDLVQGGPSSSSPWLGTEREPYIRSIVGRFGARPAVVGYRLVMPAAKSPGPEDATAAGRILLTGLSQDVSLPDLIGELAPLHRATTRSLPRSSSASLPTPSPGPAASPASPQLLEG